MPKCLSLDTNSVGKTRKLLLLKQLLTESHGRCTSKAYA
jgi:hypothetical protein